MIDTRPEWIAPYRKRDFPSTLDFQGSGVRDQRSEIRGQGSGGTCLAQVKLMNIKRLSA